MYALIDQQSIIVTDADRTLMVSASDIAYPHVRRYVIDEHGQDFEVVADMVASLRDGVKAAAAEAASVVDGADSTGPSYRVVHGDPVQEVVLASALRISADTGDLTALSAFLRRLDRNPSEASRSQLFGWLKAGGFTITTTGLIVGYKSVRHDGLSAAQGSEPVTVTHQDGRCETVTGRVPYPVGATVWMERSLVNPDRHSACSRGLHVGTFGYAENFSEQMLIVLVDPADVVSVPTDCAAQKMRVCRLFVAAVHDGEQITDAVIDVIRTIPDFDAVEAYGRRPENAPRTRLWVSEAFDPDEDDEDDEEWGTEDADDADSDDPDTAAEDEGDEDDEDDGEVPPAWDLNAPVCGF